MARRKPPSEQVEEFEAVLDAEDHVPTEEVEVKPAKAIRKSSEKKPLSRASAVKAGSQVLSTTHTILAKGLDEPALALTPEEAKRLAETAIDLLEVYGISLVTNPKINAWIVFLTEWSAVEVPRIILLVRRPPRARRSKEPEGEPPPIVLPVEEGAA